MKEPINRQQAKKQKSYEEYVKQKTPVHNVWKNMFRAFITGGTICTIGQIISNYVSGTGMDKEMTSCYTSMILVLLSVVLTGLGLYPKIANGAGQERLSRSPDLPILWRRLQSNIKKKARCSESDVRFLLLPDRSFCTESSRAGCLD